MARLSFICALCACLSFAGFPARGDDKAAAEAPAALKGWEKAVIGVEETAAAGGLLIILTAWLAGAPEFYALGGFMAAAGCAQAFNKRKLSRKPQKEASGGASPQGGS